MAKKKKIIKRRGIYLLIIGLIIVAVILLIFKVASFSKSNNTKSQEVPAQSAEIINICDTCQGHFGSLAIGVDSTKYSDYLDEKGIKQHGPTTRLWIGDKIFTVHNGQTLQVDKYSIFIEKIEVGSRMASPSSGPPPPVGGGGGLVSLRIKTDDSSRFFDFIDHLDSFPTLTPDNISRVLNVTLVKTNEINPYYFVKEAKGGSIAGFFKSVELRTPKETNKGGLLILDLRDDLGVTEQDILQKYPKAALELAEATAPVTIPYDWMIKKSWGKISFQITRDGSKKVVSVILDSID